MFKLLDPTGCTYCEEEAFQYNLPGRDEVWARTDHPDPAEPDGMGCGPGRLHLKKSLSFTFSPGNAWPWWAKGEGLIGEDVFKASFATVYLRRISPEMLARMLRPPFNWGREANLAALHLPIAGLRGADFRETDLFHADLAHANLQDANLRGASLRGANLCFANLAGADLTNCDLGWADLSFARLHGAILRGANLDGANLYCAQGKGVTTCYQRRQKLMDSITAGLYIAEYYADQLEFVESIIGHLNTMAQIFEERTLDQGARERQGEADTAARLRDELVKKAKEQGGNEPCQ